MQTESDEAVPVELRAALAGDPGRTATWAGLRPSCRREYVKWVAEAKRPETRRKRATSVLERIASEPARA